MQNIGKVLITSGEIRKKLFGIGVMNPALRMEIVQLFHQLKKEWEASEELNRRCLLKVHYLLAHSLDFVIENGNYLLGVWSEQEFESVHRKFFNILEHFSEDKLRATRLERALGLFNAVRFSPP